MEVNKIYNSKYKIYAIIYKNFRIVRIMKLKSLLLLLLNFFEKEGSGNP